VTTVTAGSPEGLYCEQSSSVMMTGRERSVWKRPPCSINLSAAVYGIDASILEVEVDVSGIKTNEDYFHTVGLPRAAVGKAAIGCVPL
jgi:hypothetical protein